MELMQDCLYLTDVLDRFDKNYRTHAFLVKDILLNKKGFMVKRVVNRAIISPVKAVLLHYIIWKLIIPHTPLYPRCEILV